ncbi:MAG: ArsA family ATPase, partial [Bacteroidales bacterium]
PAHSVSDCLEQKIGNRIQAVQGVENLSAIEINADEAFREFKEEHETEFKKLFDTSTNLDEEDIEQLMSLSIPGMDEIMSFKTIIDFMEEGKYDKYIVDTAPTGHALRLISSPKLLDQLIKVAVKMRWKYRYMITRFSGSYKPDDTDTLLLNLKKTVKKIEKILCDNTKSEFIPICIPESMAVLETGRLISALDTYNIKVRQMIVNNVIESEACSFCKEKKMAQLKYIEQIGNYYNDLNRTIIPLFPTEITGIEKLNQLRILLFAN